MAKVHSFRITFSTPHDNTLDAIVSLSLLQAYFLFHQQVEGECCGTSRCFVCEVGYLKVTKVEKLGSKIGMEVNGWLLSKFKMLQSELTPKQKLLSLLSSSPMPRETIRQRLGTAKLVNDDPKIWTIPNLRLPLFSEFCGKEFSSITRNIIDFWPEKGQFRANETLSLVDDLCDSEFFESWWQWLFARIASDASLLETVFEGWTKKGKLIERIVDLCVVQSQS